MTIRSLPDHCVVSASATVSLIGHPQEHRNFEIGFMLTRTADATVSHYGSSQQINQGVPTPIRDSDGFRPAEPWYSDAFVQPTSSRVDVSMSKTMATVIALQHQALGKADAPLGAALTDATHDSEYQLWLVARRRGAPLDHLSTHFLSGTRVVVHKDLTMTDGKPSGNFSVDVPISFTDSSRMRFRGPLPEDLGVRETSTTNVLPGCAAAFGNASFDVDRNTRQATGIANAVKIKRDRLGPLTIVRLDPVSNDSHVSYKPSVTIAKESKQIGKFEVGLIQNLLSQNETYHYSNGDVVNGVCTTSPPLRDGASDDRADPVFMSSEEPESAKLDNLRRAATLRLLDKPGMGALLDRSSNPECPNRKSGTLKRIVGKTFFRTWVAARFNSCTSIGR